MHPHFDKLVIFGLISLFSVLWLSFFQVSLPSIGSRQRRPESSINPIRNSTLGFQKIFALALPERADRIKPLLDAAKATNLSVTVLNAVRDKQILPDSWPAGWAEDQHKVGEIGCVISHVRTWQKMISSNIATALIMESDADWDLRIKEIMVKMAEGVKTIVDWPFDSHPRHFDLQTAPYGRDWDIIWMGHCGSSHYGYGRIFSWNDTTVPPTSREYVFAAGLMSEQHVPGTRTVFEFDNTVCSTAYAMSLRGAKKLKKYFESTGENLDLALSRFCKERPDLTCLGTWPQVITAVSTQSNIGHDEGSWAPGMVKVVAVDGDGNPIDEAEQEEKKKVEEDEERKKQEEDDNGREEEEEEEQKGKDEKTDEVNESDEEKEYKKMVEKKEKERHKEAEKTAKGKKGKKKSKGKEKEKDRKETIGGVGNDKEEEAEEEIEEKEESEKMKRSAGINAGPAIQYSARVNAENVIEKGLGISGWIAEWDTTWALVDNRWEPVEMVKINGTEDGGLTEMHV